MLTGKATLIEQLAVEFTNELARFCSVTGQGDHSWNRPSLILRVEYQKTDVPKVIVEFHAENGTIRGVDLGKVMDEAFRREGYDGRALQESEQLGNSLLALPSSDGSV